MSGVLGFEWSGSGTQHAQARRPPACFRRPLGLEDVSGPSSRPWVWSQQDFGCSRLTYDGESVGVSSQDRYPDIRRCGWAPGAKDTRVSDKQLTEDSASFLHVFSPRMLDGGRRSPRPGRAGDVFTDQLYTHQLLVCMRGCVRRPRERHGSARGLPRVLKRYIVATNTPT